MVFSCFRGQMDSSKRQEKLRTRQNKQIMFAIHTRQGLYQDTTEQWMSVADAEKRNFLENDGEADKIALSPVIVDALTKKENKGKIVEVTLMDRSPLVKIFFQGEGQREENSRHPVAQSFGILS